MRRAHYLKENASSETLQEAIFFDTESKQDHPDDATTVHRLWFGWACYVQRCGGGRWSPPKWFRFTTADDFWDWALARQHGGRRLWLFCHNTSFDLPILDAFNQLVRRGWKLHQAVIDAPPTILRFRQPGRKLVILDTLNWWRVPLKVLGEQVGLSKLTMPAPGAPQSEWDTYGQRDADVIRRAVCGWADHLKSNDMGGFAPTLAGQSIRLYRHRFMRHQIAIHDSVAVLELERQAYSGGRCEAFYIGVQTGEFHLLDINSMYPYVMQGNHFPTRLMRHEYVPRVHKLPKTRGNYAWVAEVTIRTDEPAYAVRHHGKLVFPVGEFRAWLTTPDLRYAEDHGHVIHYTQIACYAAAPIFREFVTTLYRERQRLLEAGKLTEAYHLKILMNSLYGKFGQRGGIWERQADTDDLSARCWKELDAETGVVTKYRQLAGLVQAQSKESESSDSFPAIAAHVTAYARLHLWRLILQAGRENVLYCDTDSLLVTATGLERLRPACHPTNLGALKLEGSYDRIQIWGCKDYQFGDKAKHKGIRKTAEQTGPSSWSQEKWSSLRGLLRAGAMDAPLTFKVSKTLHRKYDKGIVLPSGAVLPLTLSAPASGSPSAPKPGH